MEDPFLHIRSHMYNLLTRTVNKKKWETKKDKVKSMIMSINFVAFVCELH